MTTFPDLAVRVVSASVRRVTVDASKPRRGADYEPVAGEAWLEYDADGYASFSCCGLLVADWDVP